MTASDSNGLAPKGGHALLILILIVAGALEGFGQRRFELQFGARAGLPFSISMESRSNGTFSQGYDRAPFSAGPTFAVLLGDRFSVGIDALYKPVRGRGSAFSGPMPRTSTTRGSSWEFPLIADYYFLNSPVRFFLGAGLVVAETTRGSIETRTTDSQTGATTVRMEDFRASPSSLPAPIVNGGFEWRAGRILLRPEVRYTRWSRVTGESIAYRHVNQVEYLIGFSFRGYEH